MDFDCVRSKDRQQMSKIFDNSFNIFFYNTINIK